MARPRQPCVFLDVKKQHLTETHRERIVGGATDRLRGGDEMAELAKRRRQVVVRQTEVQTRMRARFPVRLRLLRLAQGLQQQDLARGAGVHEVALSYWEHGHRFPTVQNAMKLAETLNVSVRYLFGLTNRRHG